MIRRPWRAAARSCGDNKPFCCRGAMLQWHFCKTLLLHIAALALSGQKITFNYGLDISDGNRFKAKRFESERTKLRQEAIAQTRKAAKARCTGRFAGNEEMEMELNDELLGLGNVGSLICKMRRRGAQSCQAEMASLLAEIVARWRRIA